MTTPILHCPHPFRWPASRAPRRQLTHAHGAVPDYIIDYRSKRTCSIGFQSRFRDFCQDFKISGKISRFQARFQDFRQDFRDFKISGKISEISRFQARFPKDFKISIRFPKDFKDFVCECTRFQGVADPSARSAGAHAASIEPQGVRASDFHRCICLGLRVLAICIL